MSDATTPEWVIEYRRKSNAGVLFGIMLSGIALALMTEPDIYALGVGVGLVGFALFMWGCCNYSMSKGRHWIWGFLGLFTLPGLLLLMLIPKNKRAFIAEEPRTSATASPMERIAELQKLLAAGQISEAEFYELKSKIISAI